MVLMHYLVMFAFMVQVCGASDSANLPPNFRKLAKDAYTPDIIAACDCMLGQYETLVSENLDCMKEL